MKQRKGHKETQRHIPIHTEGGQTQIKSNQKDRTSTQADKGTEKNKLLFSSDIQ